MTFVPRLTAPTDFSTYYGSWNAYNRFSSYDRGNCTWYAYGRLAECCGKNIYSDLRFTGENGNAKNWIYNTWQDQTHTSGVIDIHLGDVLVWGSGTYGHVEVVEEIDGNTLTTSYSIYGETYGKSRFFGTRQIGIPTWGSYLGTVEYNDGTTAYLTNTFIGYIHNKYLKFEKKTIFFRRGDYVKILRIGKAQANGGGRNAYGIGWERRVIKTYPSQPYPIRVGFITGETTGYYKEKDLQLIRRG